MTIAVETVVLKKLNPVAGVPIACAIPVFGANEVVVTYGRAGTLLVKDTDFTVELDDPNDLDTFSITPLAPMITKIDALIADDNTEEDAIWVRRVMNFLSDASPENCIHTSFVANELTRAAARDQEIKEGLSRTLKASLSNTTALPVIEGPFANGYVLKVENGRIIQGPAVGDIESAAEYATSAGESATLAGGYKDDAETARDETLAAIAALGSPMVFKGAFDASGGAFPGTVGRKAGWTYKTTVAGTVGGEVFDLNDQLIALVDNASTTIYAGNWLRVDADLVQSVAGLVGTITASDLRTALGVLQSIDEDNMASNSDIRVPTQQSTKAYADTKIGGSTGVVDNALLRADGTGGKTAQGATAHLTDSGILRLGSTSAPHSEVLGVHVGANNPITTGITFLSSRQVTVSSAGGEHPFNDENTYNVAGGAAAASFNAAPKVIGGIVDHIAGLQFTPSIAVPGTMNDLYGHVDLPLISGGTLTNRLGVDIWEITKSGGAVVTNNYGVRIKELLAGVNNWALYTEGVTQSLLNGPLRLGTSLLPHTNDGAVLGSATRQFSDLFLAAGAVINFNNGEATITDGLALTVAGKQVVNTVPMWSGSGLAAGAGGTIMNYYGSAAVGLYLGTGAPTVSAAKGSIYIRTDATTTTTRLYINTNGTTGWTNFTTAA